MLNIILSKREKKLLIIGGLLLVIVFGWHPRRCHISQHSMFPTIINDQSVITIDKSFFGKLKINRCDIICFNHKDEIGIERFLVKRVIGMPGEKVEIDCGILYINGEGVKEDYVLFANIYNEKFIIEVPKDSYFVMGDNRPISYDSRHFGCIKRSVIFSKVIWH